jgi:hypothetical protein
VRVVAAAPSRLVGTPATLAIGCGGSSTPTNLPSGKVITVAIAATTAWISQLVWLNGVVMTALTRPVSQAGRLLAATG